MSDTEEKQIRRIAERSQIPLDKSEQIKYLSERIKQAEDALGDTQDLYEEEVKQRQKVSKLLDQRNQQLSGLLQISQRALPEKIKQKLNEILNTTVSQKLQAEDKLQQEKIENYEYEQRLSELSWVCKNNEVQIEEQEKKKDELESDLEILNNANKKQEEQIAVILTQLERVKEEKQNIQSKYFQMKVALDRMGDIKGVLNRYFANEDLFDDKMDLKHQKVQRLPQPAPPSRDNKSAKSNVPKLKPISKLKNDDDDFWKGDAKNKNSVF